MLKVTVIKYQGPLTSLAALKNLNKVEHQCATPECALQVVRDAVTLAETEMETGCVFGYSVSLGREKNA